MKTTLAIFCSVIVLVSNLSSQVIPGPLLPPTDFDPCAIPEGGCTEPWGPLQTLPMTVTCGGFTCTVNVWFKTRTACLGSSIFYDLAIGWIETDITGFQCGTCLSAIDLTDMATRALLQKTNPTIWGNTILPDQCITTYRAQAAVCWKQAIWPFSGEFIPEQYWWISCSDGFCCVRPWQVCNRFGAYIAMPMGPPVSSGQSPECATYSSELPDGVCYSICGS